MKVMTLLLLCMSAPAFAYKFTVYTDQADKTKATEVINTLKNTYPFNQYEIDFDIKLVEASELNCAPLPGIDRAMTCQSRNIARDAAANNIDQAMIVKDHPEYGGTGGSIPVMTSSSPASMAVHEYMHSLGLCDEYKYAASETEFFCKPEDAGQNMVFIDPNPAGYSSDLDARAQHMGSIPWGSGIKMETPITHGSIELGTGAISQNVLAPKNNSNDPTVLGAPIGLYEGKTCAEATPPKKTWQPGGEVTIMDQLAAGLGAGNEYLVAKALESRGVQKKIKVSEEFSLFVNNTKREAEAINYLPHPNSNTNSSSVAK